MTPDEARAKADVIVAPFDSKTHEGIIAFNRWGDAARLREAISAALLDAAREGAHEQRTRDALTIGNACPHPHETCDVRSYRDGDGTEHYHVDCGVAAALAPRQE